MPGWAGAAGAEAAGLLVRVRVVGAVRALARLAGRGRGGVGEGAHDGDGAGRRRRQRYPARDGAVRAGETAAATGRDARQWVQAEEQRCGGGQGAAEQHVQVVGEMRARVGGHHRVWGWWCGGGGGGGGAGVEVRALRRALAGGRACMAAMVLYVLLFCVCCCGYGRRDAGGARWCDWGHCVMVTLLTLVLFAMINKIMC